MNTPHTCYTIWFRQRQGSTLLCDFLIKTGVAGNPGEWIGSFWENQNIFELSGCKNLVELQQKYWSIGATENGILGVNVSLTDNFCKMMENFKHSQSMPELLSTFEVWEEIFPNHKHICLTRRNKLRQAISWWKAIQTGISHRRTGESSSEISTDLEGKYNFNAIMHLLADAATSESILQESLSKCAATPYSIVYEDFIKDYSGTVKNLLRYLGVDFSGIEVEEPGFQKLSDDISEKWYQRLLDDLSENWTIVEVAK